MISNMQWLTHTACPALETTSSAVSTVTSIGIHMGTLVASMSASVAPAAKIIVHTIAFLAEQEGLVVIYYENTSVQGMSEYCKVWIYLSAAKTHTHSAGWQHILGEDTGCHGDPWSSKHNRLYRNCCICDQEAPRSGFCCRRAPLCAVPIFL